MFADMDFYGPPAARPIGHELTAETLVKGANQLWCEGMG